MQALNTEHQERKTETPKKVNLYTWQRGLKDACMHAKVRIDLKQLKSRMCTPTESPVWIHFWKQ